MIRNKRERPNEFSVAVTDAGTVGDDENDLLDAMYIYKHRGTILCIPLCSERPTLFDLEID